MKKPILLALISCAFLSTNSFAQQKGDIELTGNLGLGSSKTEYTPSNNETQNTYFGVGLQGGYLLTDRISVGAILGYDFDKSTSDNGTTNTEDKQNLVNVGVYGRYYLPLAVERIKLDFTGAALLGSGKNTSEATNPAGTQTTEYKVTQFELGVYPGVVVGLTDRLAFTANYGALAYTHEKVADNDSDYEYKSNGFGLNVDLTTLRMGFRIFL